jgi:hypothetical protein
MISRGDDPSITIACTNLLAKYANGIYNDKYYKDIEGRTSTQTVITIKTLPTNTFVL